MVWILIITALLLLPDFYIYFSFLRESSWLWGILYWTPTVLIAVVGLVSVAENRPTWGFALMFCLILCIGIPKLCFTLISLVGRISQLFTPLLLPYFNGIGLVVSGLTLLASVYGILWGNTRLQRVEQHFSFAQLPAAFDGYKIVQLSDLHLGTYLNEPEYIQHVVEEVNAEEPDLIVFTGDLVNTRAEESTPFVEVLSQLHARDGILSILGNHDYCLYGCKDSAEENFAAVMQAEKKMGWDLLRNEHRLIARGGDTLAIVGVENTGKGLFPKKAELKRAMRALPATAFPILLSHDPSLWQMEVLPTTHIPLTLSGHTHAAHIQLGNWSPSVWMYPEWRGLYEQDGQKLYVSIGTGGSIPLRFGAWPEYNVLYLHRDK